MGYRVALSLFVAGMALTALIMGGVLLLREGVDELLRRADLLILGAFLGGFLPALAWIARSHRFRTDTRRLRHDVERFRSEGGSLDRYEPSTNKEFQPLA